MRESLSSIYFAAIFSRIPLGKFLIFFSQDLREAQAFHILLQEIHVHSAASPATSVILSYHNE